MSLTLKVAAVIRNNKGEVLLIKEQYGQLGGFKWNLIKGTYDDFTETLEECVKREISEEVGLKASAARLKKIYHYGEEGKKRILFVFSTTIDGQMPSLKSNKVDENIAEFKWFGKKELTKLTPKDFLAQYVYDSLFNESQSEFPIVRI